MTTLEALRKERLEHTKIADTYNEMIRICYIQTYPESDAYNEGKGFKEFIKIRNKRMEDTKTKLKAEIDKIHIIDDQINRIQQP